MSRSVPAAPGSGADRRHSLYIELSREQWRALASTAPLPLTQADVSAMREAFEAYSNEVKSGVFPADEHTFKINSDVIAAIEKEMKYIDCQTVLAAGEIEY